MPTAVLINSIVAMQRDAIVAVVDDLGERTNISDVLIYRGTSLSTVSGAQWTASTWDMVPRRRMPRRQTARGGSCGFERGLRGKGRIKPTPEN